MSAQESSNVSNSRDAAGARKRSMDAETHQEGEPPSYKRRASDTPWGASGTGSAAAPVNATKRDVRRASEDLKGEFRGPLVVVTGGSKGIGKACVEIFVRQGARVLFTYCSDAGAAESLVAALETQGGAGCVECRHLDQGSFSSIQLFAAEVDQWREGRSLNVLINNAALGVATVSKYCAAGKKPTTTKVTSCEKFANDSGRRRAEEDVALMQVNALGPMWLTEALLPLMRASLNQREAVSLGFKQTVLFIGSVGGASQSVFPGFRAADAMSKAALAYACKHFAARSRNEIMQLQTKGVAIHEPLPSQSGDCKSAAVCPPRPPQHTGHGAAGVNFLCLCPGATLTDMFRASTLDKMSSDVERQRFLEALPGGKLIQPHDVAEAVHWLCCCPAASIFHGAILDASAGLAVRPGALTEYDFGC